MEETTDKELFPTTCRFCEQPPGFTVYIGKAIADEVTAILKIGVTHLAVFDPKNETLTIKKIKL